MRFKNQWLLFCIISYFPFGLVRGEEGFDFSLERFIDQIFSEEHQHEFGLTLGNDIAGLKHTDRHLTNFVSLDYRTDQIPEFLKNWHSGEAEFSIRLRQDMFTPENIASTEIQTDDRPYAGHLYTRIALSDIKENIQEVYGVEIGVIGPSARAGQVQSGLHRFLGNTPPGGWDYQVRDQPTLAFTYQRAISLPLFANSPYHKGVWQYGGKVGNSQTLATTGLKYYFGNNISRDVLDVMMKDEKHLIAAFIFIAVDGEYRLLDATFGKGLRSSPHEVDIEHLVYLFSAGVKARIGKFEIGFSQKYTSREFIGQKNGNSYGIITLEFHQDF